LNENNIKVRGMCNHQDFAGVGTALPDRINRFRVEKLQSFGVNAWRMSHNPPNPELLDWTDRLGMLVWDENRFFGDFSQWYTDLKDMILRDRNHPSIIWWSLCNEWGCQQFEGDVTINIGVKFREIVKTLDPTRPISGAWNGDLVTGGLWGSKVCDIMGINYNYGAYDPFHQSYPTIPIISSESCSCTSDRSYYVNTTDAIIGPYNAWSCIRDCWQPVATRPFVIGSFDWTGFDYRGEESPTQWPSINSHFGIVDLSGFGKDDMYYSQAWFLPNQPLVHIVPQNWNSLTFNNLFLYSCATQFQWKFNNASSTGSTIESVSKPGYCIQGVNAFPANVEVCNPSDSSFIFYMDNYGQIFFYDHTKTKLCLDIYAGTGPQVGFYECKNSSGTN
jgi:beta-galactosidase